MPCRKNILSEIKPGAITAMGKSHFVHAQVFTRANQISSRPSPVFLSPWRKRPSDVQLHRSLMSCPLLIHWNPTGRIYSEVSPCTNTCVSESAMFYKQLSKELKFFMLSEKQTNRQRDKTDKNKQLLILLSARWR